jgi:hypothetical protein
MNAVAPVQEKESKDLLLTESHDRYVLFPDQGQRHTEHVQKAGGLLLACRRD